MNYDSRDLRGLEMGVLPSPRCPGKWVVVLKDPEGTLFEVSLPSTTKQMQKTKQMLQLVFTAGHAYGCASEVTRRDGLEAGQKALAVQFRSSMSRLLGTEEVES